MAPIEFTDNYEDLSTESGYQFKFNCERCGNGYMSTWKASKAGMATGLLRGAGSMLGGFLGSASNGADQLQRPGAGPGPRFRAQGGGGRDPAAVHQCKRCGQWVCGRSAGTRSGALCVDCAPMAQREISSCRRR